MSQDPFAEQSAKLLEALDFSAETERRQEQHRQQMVKLFESLLEVVDSFDRLLAAPDGGDPPPAVALNTVRLIALQLERALGTAGVTPMACQGELADPRRHEITEVRPVPEVDDDVIVEVARRGWQWDTHLLRRARVVVARNPEEDEK